MGRLQIKVIDSDGDRPQTSIPVSDAATDGTDYAAWRTAVVALESAIDGIIRCPIDMTQYVSESIDLSALPPASPDAQGSDVWVVEFSVDGMSGGPYTVSIPGADRSIGVIRNGRVELDISTGVGQTFVNAFESAYRYPFTLDGAGTGAATVQAVYVKLT